MWSAVRSAIDMGLQGQASRLIQDQTSRLMLKAEAFKDRTLEDARGQAVSAGVTVALVLFGLLFAAVAVGIGLVALYYAVALTHGPFAGFAAAGGAALVISLVIFTALAVRANRTTQPSLGAKLGRAAKDDWRRTQSAAGSTAGRTQADTLALGKQAVDTATGIVRDGSREAVLATLAATVVIGMLVGRRR
jgi:hypothetical protein